MTNKKMKEMSSTGGGAAPGTGATAIPGTGEGMATKYAFGKANLPKSKKKKSLKEETPVVEPLSTGKDPLSIANRALQIIKNRFLGMNFEECVKEPKKLDALYDDIENSHKILMKVAYKYEYTDEKLYEKIESVASDMIAIQNIVSDLVSTFRKNRTSLFNDSIKK
jgi:hypothetical protein